ncbi:MAG: hypothetical protein ACREFG_08790 [Chthoniobacterales bacterium]
MASISAMLLLVERFEGIGSWSKFHVVFMLGYGSGVRGRLDMIDRGKIAFDGDFLGLRRQFGDRRRLLIETASSTAPLLEGAEPLESEAVRHEYRFEAAQVKIAVLLEQAAAQTPLLDVETHRAPIDEVIAGIYAKWQ